MSNQYDIFWENHAVGTAQITQHGLYSKIYCKCQLQAEGIHKVVVGSGNDQINLGTLLREGAFYCLTTTIVTKRLQTVDLVFSLISKKKPEKRIFIPIQIDIPFAHISDLNKACFEKRGETIGISLEKLQ